MPGNEAYWSLVTGYLVHQAERARRWEDAEWLQRKRVDWTRQRAATALAKSTHTGDASDRYNVGSLGSSLHELSGIQREQGLAICVEGYREALSLAESTRDPQHAASCAFNLGHAYKNLDEIRDLALAEEWYRRSF